jgi:transglutaminase-like putative cysteine protease
MKLLTAIGLTLCLVASTLYSAEPSPHSKYQELLQKQLAAAGSNRTQLQQALEKVPAEQSEAMQFLIAYMPPSDAKTLSSDFLLKNCALAFEARHKFPWAKALPEEIFLNDVLPYASLNEARDEWRQDFLQKFTPLAEKSTNQLEAIKSINAAIKDIVKVEYNTKRKKPDQSPAESMQQGMASCTGLSILLVDAFRAVGIPARVVGIPAWTTKPGNHNWVEVWSINDRKWHVTEYYPDSKGLDHGWMLADAAKANPKSIYHSIYASSWKKTGTYFPLVWNLYNHEVNAVNVTKRYIELGGTPETDDSCELRIEYKINNQRIPVKTAVFQGDLKIAAGTTPKRTDDLNRFFTANLHKGQIYQVQWQDSENKKARTITITTPKDKNWCILQIPPRDHPRPPTD